MHNIYSFAPIIDMQSRVLILGSMPGKISLEMGQYYAHPLNNFWTFLYSVFDAQPDITYEAKKSFLMSKHIALWDVIKNCQRSGSLDSKIINPNINDFGSLFNQHTNIKYILFNGKKAEQVFKIYLKTLPKFDIKLLTLPSSSPANAGVSQTEKLKAWSVIKDLVK